MFFYLSNKYLGPYFPNIIILIIIACAIYAIFFYVFRGYIDEELMSKYQYYGLIILLVDAGVTYYLRNKEPIKEPLKELTKELVKEPLNNINDNINKERQEIKPLQSTQTTQPIRSIIKQPLKLPKMNGSPSISSVGTMSELDVDDSDDFKITHDSTISNPFSQSGESIFDTDTGEESERKRDDNINTDTNNISDFSLSSTN
jgi:hypothetical protein